MKILIKLHLVLIFCIVSMLSVQAQSDSTDEKTYDIVYLTKGGVIKGEIMSFNEEHGTLVIKDNSGRVYSLGKEEYSYYVENQVQSERPPKVLWPRKTEGFLFTAQFGWSIVEGPGYELNGQWYQNSTHFSYAPITAGVGLGKVFENAHYAGFSAEIAMVSDMDHYFNAGGRYHYSFLSDKRNTTLYLPFELKYYNMSSTMGVRNSNYEDEYSKFSLQSVGVSVGTGMSIARPKMKAVNLELLISKHFSGTLKAQNLPAGVTFTHGDPGLFTASLSVSFTM